MDLDKLELTAQALLGVPWVDESWDPQIGLDCWSLTWILYDAAGVTLPTNLWAAKPLFTEADRPGIPGDIVYFEPPGAPRPHLGVKLRGSRFVDCNWGSAGVSIQALENPRWRLCLRQIFRYTGGAGGTHNP